MVELNLEQFTGTENWYKHSLTGYLYTDGIKYLCEKAQCYWLIDDIFIKNKFSKKLQNEEFQSWELKAEDSKGTLVCTDGNKKVLYSKRIDYTDFPLLDIKLFFQNNVLLLTSEY